MIALAPLLCALLGAASAEAPSKPLRDAAQDQLSRGDDRAAAETAARAIAADRRDVRAYNLRAIAHQHLGDYAAELADVDAGLAVDPRDGALLRSKATALNRLGRPREALAAADGAVAADPQGYYAHLMRAQALAGLGEQEPATAALRKAAELNPGLYQKLQEALKAASASEVAAVLSDARRPRSEPPRGGFSPWAALALLGGLGGLGAAFAARQAAAPRPAPSFPTPFPTPMPELLKGQYRTSRQIGAGGMGLVYDGLDVSLERRVAIKRMREEIRTDPRERDRFVAEAKLVATLHHPNIVDIYAILEEGADVYLVFEHVSGKTLYELLAEKGRFTFAEALPVARGIAAALEYAHGRSVIHRDLKPSNVMIDEHGQAKVMDFGVARQAKDALIKVMTNTIVGTPPYMAPEQEEGHVRRESDVFSLGVCLYEMLSGKLPFAGTGAGMHLNKKNRCYVPLSAMAPGLPKGLDDVMDRALDPDPNTRARTAKDFASGLEWLA